jgi:hypothetical protein
MKATAAEKAGISCDEQSRLRQLMFTRRSFLSHLHLATIDFKIWSKATFSPQTGTLVRGSLPAFAFG